MRDSYEIALVARDRGTPAPLESSLSLAVKVDPNYFNFNQQKNDRLDLEAPDIVYMNENWPAPAGKNVGQVRALNSFRSIVDEAAANAANRTVTLTYRLLTVNDTFRIDRDTGKIEVADSSRLDYERVKEFMLVVEAREVQQTQSFSKFRLGQTRWVQLVFSLVIR